MSISYPLSAPIEQIPRLILPKPVAPPKNLPIWKFMQAARDNVLTAIPAPAYEVPIHSMDMLWFRGFIVSDPEAIGRVLLDNAANYVKAPSELRFQKPALGNGLFTSEGAAWRAHRRIMAPAFDMRSLAAYAPVITDVAAALAEDWAALPAGSVIDVAKAMSRATLQVISRTMFSSDSDGIIGLVRAAFEAYQADLPAGLADLLPFLAAWRERQLVAFGRKVFARFDEAYEILAAGRVQATAEGPRDLLSRLLQARDEEGGGAMSAREVRDQVLTIFLAGHETTTLALTWVWFLLSQHPAEEAKLHAELERVLGDRKPSREDVPQLVYTRRIIEESMRLYPPVASLSLRTALASDTLCGERVPPGCMIGIHPWVVHRHHLLWEDPDRFDPDRFTPEKVAALPRFAYLPFGGGPRICIGAGFAMLEAMLILASLAQRFRLRLAEGHVVEPQANLTLRARYGMKMVIEPRHGA